MKYWHYCLIWIVLFVLVVLSVVGCSGSSIPAVAEAPYKITWRGEEYGTVYCDNYELGSSVVIEGYWEYGHYVDNLLILDASKVVIETREAAK